ncbi:MAG: hypothetical protein CM1200mP40_25510 [Gammaproteobacteria bacterium]|nr:MAG: hypothetical protein CM1200mP40_25510 [Gammaproteobacteria bacterium]
MQRGGPVPFGYSWLITSQVVTGIRANLVLKHHT